MKNALILHGAGNNSKGNWFPWLKKELEEKGFKVWVPDLPDSEHPVQKDWLETILRNRGWEFNKDSVFIGHSSGATLILRILENLPENLKIQKAILVAGPLDKGSIEKYWPFKEDLTKSPFDWEKIKKSAKEFVLIYSDNDPYDCGMRHGRIIHSKLGGELVIKKGEGHFNLEANPDYKEFPDLLKLIGSPPLRG